MSNLRFPPVLHPTHTAEKKVHRKNRMSPTEAEVSAAAQQRSVWIQNSRISPSFYNKTAVI